MYCCVVADMRSTSNLAVTGVHTSSHSGSLKHSSDTYCDVRGSKYKYKYKHIYICLMNTCASSLVSTHCLLEAAGRGDWRVPGARAAITTA